ncbi:hypothetical protein [Microseira wollei]|nr:hypothetical protein [Microseira wollei]
MSSSASAATLRLIGGVVGLARQNTSSTKAGCTPSLSGWTVKLSCYQNYTASTLLGVSTAGRLSWRDIFQAFEFTGNPGRRYRITYSLTGDVFASVKGAGLAGANAASGLAPRSGSPVTRVNLLGAIASTSSDWDWHSSVSSFDFNGGSSRIFRAGAHTQGSAVTFGVGFAEARSNINFTSIARITDIGRSFSSVASLPSFASASSSRPLNTSDDEVASVPDEDLINFPDEDVTNISDEYLINLPDDDVANISDEDLINLPGDDVVASVPESSTVAGLAVVLTILLATQHSRFAKKHTEDTDNLVDTTAVEV